MKLVAKSMILQDKTCSENNDTLGKTYSKHNDTLG